MNRSLLFFLIVFSVSVFNAQTSATAAILDSDSLPDQVVFYVPTVTTAQITSLQTEFAAYPQIQNALYVATHKCILIDMGDVANKRFFTYGQLTKVMAQYINYKDIRKKSSSAYATIKSANDSSGIIIK